MKNVCIVGYGAIGPIHAHAVGKCPNARLYAVCDINKERAEKCQKEYGVKAYTDFDEMLTDKEIDTVHICTPHYLHFEMAIKALSADKDIVLEKPVTMLPAELEKLMSFKTDRKICVMLQNRTNNCAKKLYEIINKTQPDGKVLSLCAFLTWCRTPEYYKSDEWRGKLSTEGGGLLINQAIHTLDFVGWFGGGIKSVMGSISTKKLNGCIEVEDTADALIELTNGNTAVFYATNGYSQSSAPRIEIQCENALYRYADERLYRITEDDVQIIETDIYMENGKRYWGSGHRNVINAFYSSLCGENAVYTDLQGAKNTMDALFAFYESAKTNKKIAIKE